jgi:hypothetical protein
MRVSRELLQQMFALGTRRITDARFYALDPEPETEPTAQVWFEIEAPDAPDGTVYMEPTYRREADGTVTMLDPGWTAG